MLASIISVQQNGFCIVLIVAFGGVFVMPFVSLVALMLRRPAPLHHALPRPCSTIRPSTQANGDYLSIIHLQLTEIPITQLIILSHELVVLQLLPLSRKLKHQTTAYRHSMHHSPLEPDIQLIRRPSPTQPQISSSHSLTFYRKRKA